MKGKKKVFYSWLIVLLVGVLCFGAVSANAETDTSIPAFSGYSTGTISDANSGYTQSTYYGISLSQMKTYEQKLVSEGYTLYDQQEIENGTNVNRFATYVKDGTMIHLNLFPSLTMNRFHIIYGPADKLVPNTPAGSYSTVVTPSVATIERTDGVLCMVVQLADGSYYIIDGGYGFSTTEPTTLPAKEEHRDGSGVTYTYTRDHKKDMATLLTYLQDTNRDGKINSADQRPQVNWMITHADADHIQLPYIFIQTYSSKFDLNAVYYNFPKFESIGLSSSYTPEEFTKRAWESFVGTVNAYFPNAKEYIYHTGQVVDLPGCKLEFLYTPEDMYPLSMTTPNHTCGIWRFCFDGGKTFVVTGDAEVETNKQAAKVLGDYLKSDILQVIHHGSNGGTTEFYNAVDPDICLWPCLDISFYHDLRHLGSYSGYAFNKVLRNGQRTHYTTSSTNTVFVPTLRYDANGGTGTVDVVGTLYCGETASEGTSPNGMVTVAENSFSGPTGKGFQGWATTPNGSVKYSPGDQIELKTDTVLYAVWKEQTYTVTFMDGDSVVKTETVPAGADVTLPELPENHVCSVSWSHDGKNITSDLIIKVVYTEHAVSHVAAAESTYNENGNVEYWHCGTCGRAWLDAECTVDTDLQAVKLPLLEAAVSVGDVNYGSLEDAVAAANATQEADVITILKDLQIESTLVITTDMTITADRAVEISVVEGLDNHMIHVNGGKLTLAGKSQEAKITLTAAATTRNLINIKSSTGVEIINVHLAGNKNSTASKNYANGINIDAGTFTAQNVTVTDVPYRGVRVAAGGVGNLKNVSISNVGGHGVFVAGTVHVYDALSIFNAGFNNNENGINVAADGKLESHFESLSADTYAIAIDTTTNRGIIVQKGGILNITNVSIKNTTSYALDLFASEAVATVTNAIITDTSKAVKAATGSSLTVKNVTVQTCEEAVISIASDALTAESEQITVLRHTEAIDEAVAATCTETGLTEGKHCTACKEVLIPQTVVAALGHDYQVSQVPAACDKEGSKTTTCARCDYHTVETLPASGHSYENGKCTVCGEADPDYVEPIVKFDFSGSTMTLGNELVLNFVYNKALLTGTDNYAQVTIAREDGDYTYEIPQSEWTAFNAALNQIPV
ncbi:MAG: InlB B-repeat-containing protein, partial [Oscillospiraceae bacterium]|nr:InlB B-repeat-containing protein [Oscillospiraceae bacterium]